MDGAATLRGGRLGTAGGGAAASGWCKGGVMWWFWVYRLVVDWVVLFDGEWWWGRTILGWIWMWCGVVATAAANKAVAVVVEEVIGGGDAWRAGGCQYLGCRPFYLSVSGRSSAIYSRSFCALSSQAASSFKRGFAIDLAWDAACLRCGLQRSWIATGCGHGFPSSVNMKSCLAADSS
ncbi:hypothetical protein Droror1_Dr00011677 [Drosera rotundifolia]